ncbi:unnamed protein product [Caenorhabditis brenneri]
MRPLDVLKIILCITSSFFFTFRTVVVPYFMIEDSFLLAAIFSLFHVFVCLLQHKAKSTLMSIIAYLSLFLVMIVELVDFSFNDKSITMYYAAKIDEYFLGNPSNTHERKILLIDTCFCFLSLISLFVDVIDKEHKEFSDLLEAANKAPKKSTTPKSKSKPTLCFSTNLTENGDGYFEDIYGELQHDNYKPTVI